MIMYNKTMANNKGAFRKGFTIIEVMLFLALSGLLLVGVLGGLGDNISRQRYNDAVQDVVNMMRDQYSFVSDTQIAQRTNKKDSNCYGLVGSDIGNDDAASYYRGQANNTPDSISYRGRTNCVVYGAVVSINENYVETTELLGRDYETIVRQRAKAGDPVSTNLSDIAILHDVVNANNVSLHCDPDSSNCYVRSADNSRIQRTKWGTKLQNVDKTPIEKTMIIFRSPRDGSIRTYVYEGGIKGIVNGSEQLIKYEDINKANGGLGVNYIDSSTLDNYGVNRYLTEANFRSVELNICVDSSDAQTYNSARRMVKVKKGAMSQSGVELMNLDIAKDASEGENSGVRSCD